MRRHTAGHRSAGCRAAGRYAAKGHHAAGGCINERSILLLSAISFIASCNQN